MVNSQTILRDTISYLKNFLIDNITDPINLKRPANQRFIMTSYPQRPVEYPLITIKDSNSFNRGMLGLQSEAALHFVEMEIRIWGRNVVERDTIADEIYSDLKDNQIGSVGTSQANDLHDLQLLSSVNVDESDGPKSKVMTFRFMLVA